MKESNYIWYLIMSMLFWTGFVIVYKYAINEGHINLIILLIVTVIGVFYALVNLALAKSNYSKDKQEVKK